MSLYDYQKSIEISRGDPPFAALIMAAMRKADSDNLILISRDWPNIVNELAARHNAPGGLLKGEKEDK